MNLRLACRCALSGGVPRRSLIVALVVGTVLNLIIQGDALFGAMPLNWLKVILTYFVPYAVCTYGAVFFHLRTMHSQAAESLPTATGSLDERPPAAGSA